MAARGKLPSETMPKAGKVSEVVQEWLVKEDGALAQRLQSEEISQHYEQNRYRNGVLRDDAPRARHQQLVEDHLAARRQALEQQRLLDQYAADAETARRLAAEDALAAARGRRRQEDDDARMAALLADEDKQERRQMRERRQVVQEARLLGLETRLTQMALRGEETAGSTSDDPAAAAVSPHSTASCSTVFPPAAGAAASTALQHPMPYSDDDLSDLMAPPPSGELLSEDDIRTWQERQDEEVARLLQEQDGKRRGDVMPRGQRVALEAQDRELAKVLQEQERARLRRAKDRARERRRQKQQEQLAAGAAAAAGGSEDELLASEAGAEAETSVMRLASCNGVYSPVSPAAWIPVESAVGGPMMGEPPRETSSPLPPSSHPLSSHHRPLPHSVAAGGVSNIAMMIDPTYQRRHRSQQLLPPPTAVRTERHSPGATLATPISHHQLQQHSPQPSMQPPLPVRTDRMYEAAEAYSDEEEEAQFVPPYMPIQGQRRGNSLEKRRQRRSRDANCKQQ